MNVIIYRLKRSPGIDSIRVKRLVRAICRKEGCAASQVNVILTNDAYLRSLNRTFFHKDRSTNVIAFALDELAEIYVSMDRARDRTDTYYFIAHGLLHIAGYDHPTAADERRMNRRCLEHVGKAIGKRNAR